MNSVFARVFVTLSLIALPASALASTPSSAKHHSVAKKDPTTKKKGKHHGHHATPASVASHPSKDASSAAKAP